MEIKKSKNKSNNMENKKSMEVKIRQEGKLMAKMERIVKMIFIWRVGLKRTRSLESQVKSKEKIRELG